MLNGTEDTGAHQEQYCSPQHESNQNQPRRGHLVFYRKSIVIMLSLGLSHKNNISISLIHHIFNLSSIQ